MSVFGSCRAFVLSLALISTLFLSPRTMAQSSRSDERQHPSVRATLRCISQLRPIVQNRRNHGPDVQCTIPVSLSEHDLDEIFKAALRSAKMSDRMRGRAEKYSSLIAKTLTNFRAADCTVRLHIKRANILRALNSEATTLHLPDQPTDCNVTTKKYKKQRLRFSFAPRIDMKNGCVENFRLNMGKIDAGCKICYFNRLYLSTKLIGVWGNSMGNNFKRALNMQLGGACR